MTKKIDYLFTIGRPFSPLYGAAMKMRERLYQKGVLKSQSLAVPVISIGNLVLGGTGKTPTVQYIAELLRKIGRSPAVISRGYGGTAGGSINVVSDGKNILLSPEAAGDEPYMLAQRLKNIPVVTGVRRIKPCKHAIEEFGADILILDDGFQHLAVRRDIDFVLFDATFLAGNSRIFPGGPLREPISALRRCDSFIITGIFEKTGERAERFRELLKARFSGKPTFFAFPGNARITDRNGNEPEDISRYRFYGFCGIANPTRFTQTLTRLDIDLAGVHNLRDHAVYNQNLIVKLQSLAVAQNADCFITTLKDYVKLQDLESDLPIFILDAGYVIEDSFDNFLLEKLEGFAERK